jgi:hypothetical protein
MLSTFVAVLMALSVDKLFTFGWKRAFTTKDDTDGPNNKHSGLLVLVDSKTGQEYLVNWQGGMCKRESSNEGS